jgi:hypothetical protein
MFEKPSLVTRVAVAKVIGFVIGLIGLFIIPYLWPDSSWMERLGFLFWYTTLGAFIGLAGVFTWHPVLKLPMPWWINAPIIGAWMNFVLTLFIHDRLAIMMLELMGENGLFMSPFWFVFEGAIFGLLIGYFATRFGGEGPKTVQHQR